MESNEKYQVRCIVDNTQTEIKAMQEKDNGNSSGRHTRRYSDNT